MAYTASITDIGGGKLNATQIENIISELVPRIANPEDYEFFKGILTIKLEACADCLEAERFISSLHKRD